MFFGIRGSGENGKTYDYGYGQEILSMKNYLQDLVPGMKSESISYPAIDVDPLDLLYRTNYDNSVSSGVATAMTDYVKFQSTCPQTPIVLAGYSQGVDVAYQVSSLLPAAAQTRAIIVGFGDPHFNPDQSWADAGNYYHAFRGILEAPRPLGWGELPHTWLGSYAPHLRSWCLHGDDICNFTGLRVTTCLVSCTHETGYISSGYTRNAASWAYSQWKKLPSPSPTPTPTPSSPSPTPTPTPTTGTGSWTAAEAPLPPDAQSNTGEELSGVSCPSVSQCVAVGSYDVADQGGVGLLLTGTDGSWTAAGAPLPAHAASGGASVGLSGVSCPSVSQCVAVGEYNDTAGVGQGLVVTDSGGSWTAEEAPLPANAGVRSGMYEAQLSGVSCPSVSQCVAVGEYNDSQGGLHGLLLTLSKGSWTAAEAPLPDIATGGGWLTGVSCPSVSQCVAVGEYGAAGTGGVGMLLTGTAGSWTAASAPLPANNADAGNTVSAVSCPSVSQCVAVGHYGPSTNGQMGLLLTDSGGSWTAAEAPLAANGANGGEGPVPSVSCGALSQCVAVGTYYDNSGSDYEQGLLLTDSDGSWSAAPAPLPANAQTAPQFWVNGVSCPSAAQCVAVGNYSATSGSGGLLLTRAG